MSILQEYQKHEKYIGKRKMNALLDYIKLNGTTYSDVIYNKKKWEEFDKWYIAVYNKKHGKSSGGNQKV